MNIENLLNVAACVCGKDGLISEAEENMMFQVILKKFPDYLQEDFEKTLDIFFDSTAQIEDYAARISDKEQRMFTLFLAKESASVDGLDIRENIALQKVTQIWGENTDE
jgi:hypothetical protein